MTIRRIVGIDLGVTTSHTVVVIDETTEVLARRRCRPTRESLGTIEQAALAGAPASTTLEVIMEPTGAAWLPVAVFFARRGHVVHRVSSAKASAMRRFLSQHTKANSIDAEALARLAIVDPGGLQPLRLVEGPAATLDRRVRAADRLTDAANSRKVRLRELARQAMPMIDLAVTGELGVADIAVLERYGDPRQLLRAGRTRLLSLITKASRGHHGETRADAWRRVAELALELYGADPAVPFEDLAAEMATEARLIRALVAERDAHARQRELAYRVVDPDGLARTLPGVAEIGGPVIVSTMGEPSRFGGTASFKRFTGLTPRASETGNSDRKGGAMSKAGPRRLRDQLVQSANTARRLDPQLAAIYFTQMERGAHHQKALCVVAARLAERAWIVMSSGKPYQLRDVDGTPVTAAEARDIIRQRYTVSEEVRRRRRSRKTAGKAPQQVLEAHGLGHARHRADSRGDLPRVITQLDAVPPIKPFSATRA